MEDGREAEKQKATKDVFITAAHFTPLSSDVILICGATRRASPVGRRAFGMKGWTVKYANNFLKKLKIVRHEKQEQRNKTIHFLL